MGQLVLTQLLYDALDSEIGIVVETPDPEFLRQKLYAERNKSPEFDCLAFVISPLNKQDLWILNKGSPKNE